MLKFDAKSLIPTITYFNGFTHVTFSYDIESKEEAEDYQDVLEEFIEKAHNEYYKKFTTQPYISKSTRKVNSAKLAADIIFQTSSSNNVGPIRFTIFIVIETLEKPNPIVREEVKYTLNWYTDVKAERIQHFPIGFFSFEFNKFLDNTMGSTVVFDLRVLDKDIEASRDFYIDEVIKDLDLYFFNLSHIFKSFTDKEPNIKFSEIKETLKVIIDDYYSGRLEDNGINERQILFLSTVFAGFNDDPAETDPTSIEMSVFICVDIDLTSTPELHVSHPKYESTMISKDHVLNKWTTDKIKTIKQSENND